MESLTRLFDFWTGIIILAMAMAGIILRIRRTARLRQVVLPSPPNELDAEVLAAKLLSSYLRLAVKVVFVLLGVMVVFDADWLWAVWRLGVIAVLGLLIWEAERVDRVRDHLARAAESG